ncbi:hypothetical protein [Wenzhouxiangella marina]|uniref:Uncharacterized protein n=1 Tax=Wenzhouxiangella marina TaxID=1579979 RepID=A0A0K0XS92_9GAMM|nr:hypothetical protein [Wenzhouxiangella marina]AKS40491.1 hypothetical protein WM2015_100 [Wenzhouxiangella marina]MBB6088187.1 hypothetical protein [Wenzhouxiangella marina]
MNLIKRSLMAALLCLALVGCQSDPADEAQLQVHDVSGLEQRNLEAKLNALLEREDLALTGRVSLLENDQLAVNGPARLQQEIADILAALRSASPASETLDGATYRVRYWLLTMEPGEQTSALPTPIQAILPSLQDEFPGYAIRIGDYIESYHYGHEPRSTTINSGAGSRVSIRSMRPTADGLEAELEMTARPVYEDRMAPRYRIHRLLADGQPVVVGRSYDQADDGQPAYQVLLLQADLMEATD